jgi:hypothetical protein
MSGVIAGLVIAGISAAVAAGGAVYSGVQQSNAADYNAAVAEQDALAANDRAKSEEDAHRESIRRILATQRALYGKSGLSMEGSPLLVMEDTAAQGELDALTIRYGGDIAAAKGRSSANLSRMQGGAAKTASYFQAGSTLLSGASSGAFSYNKAKK